MEGADLPPDYPSTWSGQAPLTRLEISVAELLIRFDVKMIRREKGWALIVAMNGKRPMPIDVFVEAMEAMSKMVGSLITVAKGGEQEIGGRILGLSIKVKDGMVHFDEKP